jgi:hypothetical protein
MTVRLDGRCVLPYYNPVPHATSAQNVHSPQSCQCTLRPLHEWWGLVIAQQKGHGPV